MHPRVLWPELLIGLGLAVLRVAIVRPDQLWRDWLLVLGGVGITWALARRSAAAPIVLATAAAYLLAVQVFGQLPQTLTVWGLY